MTELRWRAPGRDQVAPVVLVLVAAVIYGKLTSLIPSPTDPNAFWIGNTASPWLLLAFVAGATQEKKRYGALLGAVADVAIVVAFYSQFLFLNDDGAGLASRVVSWIEFIGPWSVVAIAGGATYGYIGSCWRSIRSQSCAVLLALPFVGEAVVQKAADGRWPGSPIYFAGLGIVGVVLAILTVATSRHRVSGDRSRLAE